MDIKLSSILTSMMLVGLIAFVIKLLNWVWFKPKRLEKLLRQQGLGGNPYRFLIGDMKDIMSIMKSEQPKTIQISDDLPPHALPFYHHITSKYGQNAFMWFGPIPKLIVSDPQLLKEILSRCDVFHKPVPDPIGETVAGGLAYLEDDKWAKHRKIVGSAFQVMKLKNMAPAMSLSCSNMIKKWESLFPANGEKTREIDVWPYLQNLSGDVISRTAFGSSYEEGQRIFELHKEQVKLVMDLMPWIYLPGWSYLPTKANKRMNVVSKEIQVLLRGIIDKKEKAMRRGEAMENDLLSSLVEANVREIREHGNKKNMGMSIKDVMEECKLLYLAGSETSSNLLAWTMVMLSKHQEWQNRAREEVLQVFGNNEPTFDCLNRLKTVTMILNEVLRLYSPITVFPRSPIKTIKVGNITLPVGVDLMLLIGLLHHDPKFWGDDVKEFKPERFADGISSASKTQFSFLPFSAGPRVCIGQNFAMVEAKIALSMILQHFSFELSSSYLHAPFPILTLQPQHGVTLSMHKLSN